jgi:chemotaxis family two-component system response regulator Rcp1
LFRILLAEDNPGDVRLFVEALNGRNLQFDLTLAEDGQKALALVRSAAAGDPANSPDIIVLDVNLPKHNGDEVLRQVRAEPTLRSVPVVMLTSSESPADQARAVELGADLYIRKPSDLNELMEIAKVIEDVVRRTKS